MIPHNLRNHTHVVGLTQQVHPNHFLDCWRMLDKRSVMEADGNLYLLWQPLLHLTLTGWGFGWQGNRFCSLFPTTTSQWSEPVPVSLHIPIVNMGVSVKCCVVWQPACHWLTCSLTIKGINKQTSLTKYFWGDCVEWTPIMHPCDEWSPRSCTPFFIRQHTTNCRLKIVSRKLKGNSKSCLWYPDY